MGAVPPTKNAWGSNWSVGAAGDERRPHIGLGFRVQVFKVNAG
jgi:hypothetical protein